MSIADRPDKSILPLLELVAKMARATNEAEREKLREKIKELEPSYENSGAERFFAGKLLDDSLVKLADKQGRPRLLLKVDGAGEPSVEFLDEAGKVTRRMANQ